MTKELAQLTLDNLPDEFELDELLERLVFVAQVEKGRADVRQGKTIPHSEIEKLVKEWKKSGGPKKQRTT